LSQLDLNNLPPGHHVNIAVERQETDGERKVRLFKEVVIFLLAGIVVGICVITLSNPGATADEKKWAMSIITAAAGGVIGYLLKRQAPRRGRRAGATRERPARP
jgi:hypothetical protein